MAHGVHGVCHWVYIHTRILRGSGVFKVFNIIYPTIAIVINLFYLLLYYTWHLLLNIYRTELYIIKVTWNILNTNIYI